MMKIKFLCFFALLLNICSPLSAQTASSKLKKDSVLSLKLDSQLNKVQQLSAERLADSLKRADLERQVAQLSDADNFKKVELLNELNGLKQKDSIKMIRQKAQIDSLRKIVKGFPVKPFRDVLFYIYARQGSFTAEERAEAINTRLRKLSDDYSFKPDSLKIAKAEQTIDVLFKNGLIVSVSEQDALWANQTKENLADQFREKIAKAVVQYQHETSWQTLLKESLLALLVIVVVVLLIYGINRLFRMLRVKLRFQQGLHLSGFRIRNYELLNPEQQLTILNFIINLLRWVIILLVVYLALPVLFGIFPFTRNISETLLDYILSPLRKMALAVWNYIPNFITIVVIVLVFRYFIKFLHYIKSEIESGRLHIPGFYPDWANPTYQIVRILVLAFMLVVIFPYMPGHDSPIFQGVSVFLGVLFTFGSAGALGNVVAGLVLTYMRAFKIGDRVKIGDVSGDIIEKTILVTRIRTIQNEIISIPNSTVMSSHTINYSSESVVKGLIIHTTVTIGYDVPWRDVHKLLIDAALDTKLVEKEPAPYVLQTSLDDYYVSYRINAYTKQPNKQAVIYSSLHENIQDQFNKAGVEIMSPHYKALRDGNATTIPADYLPEDYQAPAFKTENSKGKS